jgi:hypothetical protein
MWNNVSDNNADAVVTFPLNMYVLLIFLFALVVALYSYFVDVRSYM